MTKFILTRASDMLYPCKDLREDMETEDVEFYKSIGARMETFKNGIQAMTIDVEDVLKFAKKINNKIIVYPTSLAEDISLPSLTIYDWYME